MQDDDTPPAPIKPKAVPRPATLQDPLSKAARAERLVLAREAWGISQADFARQIGISAQSLGQMESGAGTPDSRKWQAICAGLGVTLDWLWFGKADSLSPAAAKRIYGRKRTDK